MEEITNTLAEVRMSIFYISQHTSNSKARKLEDRGRRTNKISEQKDFCEIARCGFVRVMFRLWLKAK